MRSRTAASAACQPVYRHSFKPDDRAAAITEAIGELVLATVIGEDIVR